MKKLLITLLTVSMLCSITACGGSNKSSKSDTNTTESNLQADYDKLKTDYDNLKMDNNALSDDYNRISKELEELKTISTEPIVAETEPPATESNENDGLLDVENGIPVYDDEYVTISYLGCEKGRRREEIVFYAINKTEVELVFQGSSLAINGESLGYVSGSDSIAPLSKGKIRYSTKEEFPTYNPDDISGVLKVVDFSQSLFGKSSYEYSFTNLKTN